MTNSNNGSSPASAASTGTAPPTGTLICLSGAPVPPSVAQDWRHFASMSREAVEHIWEVLELTLRATPDAQLEQQAGVYCQTYQVQPAVLSGALRACRFLLLRAAPNNLSLEQFSTDVATVAQGEIGAGGQILLAGYEQARDFLRSSIVAETLFDHGDVLVGLDWRVDLLTGSDRGLDLMSPAAVVTLRLRGGHGAGGSGDNQKDKRVTFYAVPDAIRQIRETCDQIEVMMARSQQLSQAAQLFSQHQQAQAQANAQEEQASDEAGTD